MTLAPITAVAALLLGAAGLCSAQHAKIDTSKFAPPKSVVLVDIPRMPALALIGVMTTYHPGTNQWHFHERADNFFELPDKTARSGNNPPGTLTGANAYEPGGAIGSLIMNSGAETQRRASGFEAEVLKRDPGFDLRDAFMKALLGELEARGIAVKIAQEGRAAVPRLRWPALDARGNPWPSGSADSSPAVDADLLVQVAPIAFYHAVDPLNAYHRNVTVAVALFNGRSKQFLGRQTFRFRASDSSFEYSRYDSLVEDLAGAAPALRDALLSLAGPVADIINGKAPAD